MLKRGSRDSSRTLKHASLLQLFRLLDSFTAERNFFAPVIYKTLIFSLIENHHEHGTREFMLLNLLKVFKKVPSIPVDILLNPLLKQIRVSEGISFSFKVFDFYFFSQICQHPKFSLNTAIQTIDMLAKVYLEDVRFSLTALTPLMLIIQRFLRNGAMLEYVKELVKMFIVRLQQLENRQWEPQAPNKRKNLGGGGGPVPIGGPRSNSIVKYHGSTFKNTKPSVEAVSEMFDEGKQRKIRKGLILELLRRLKELRVEDLSDELKRQLLLMNMKFKKRYNRDHRGVMGLLKSFGDAEDIVLEFEADYLDKIKREEEYSNVNTIIEEVEGSPAEPGARREFSDNQSETRGGGRLNELGERDWNLGVGRKGGHLEAMADRSAVSDIPKFRGGKRGVVVDQQTRMYVPFQKTMNRMERKAMLEIEVMRLKKEARQEKRKMEEERRLIRQKKIQEAANRELERRKIAEGKDPLALPSSTFLERNFTPSPARKTPVLKKHEIVAVDLKEEPVLERQKVSSLFKKYGKLLKQLMSRYAKTGYQMKRVAHHLPAFDEFKPSNSLTLAEVQKMLADHYFTNAMVTQEAMVGLLRQLNARVTGKADTKPITSLDMFQDFLLQVAVHVYSKPPKQLLNTAPSSCLAALFEQFEFATRAKGQSTALFQEANTGVSGSDKDLIRSLNQRLQHDPQADLPQGFTKVKEKQFKQTHSLPSLIQMPSSMKISVQILDSILENALGFHLMEPLTQVNNKYRAKKLPRSHSRSGSTTHLDRSTFLERRAAPTLMNSRMSGISTGVSGAVYGGRNKLSTAMKLTIAEQPVEEREQMQQTGEVLFDMIEAVAQKKLRLYGRSYISKSGTDGKIENKAMKEKREAKLANKREEQERAMKVEQRRKAIAKELDRVRKEREERIRKQEEERKVQLAKEEKKKKKLAELDLKLRKEYEAKRAARVAEEQKKLEKEKERQFEREAREKKQNAVRLKMKQAEWKEELKQLSDMNKANREAGQEEAKEIKKQPVKVVNKEKEELHASRQNEADFMKLMGTTEVSQIMDDFSKPIKSFYQHYVLENGEATGDLLKMAGWKKLGQQFGIVPQYTSNDSYTYVMEHIARKNEGEAENALTEKQFKEALLRVATLAQYKLQGLKEPRKKKSFNSPEPGKKLSNGVSRVKISPTVTESLVRSPSPRQAVALQECKVLWQRQRSEISKLMSGINSAVNEWKEENSKLTKIKKGKVELSEFVLSLDKVKGAFAKMNQGLHEFTTGFVNSIAKAVLTNVQRAQGNADIIEQSGRIEQELQRVLRSFSGVVLEQLGAFKGTKGNLVAKKKNADDQKRLEALYEEVLNTGQSVQKDLESMLGASQKRAQSIKRAEQRKPSVKRSGTLLLRNKESDNRVVAQTPTKKAVFSMENMKWQIFEKFLKEVLGMESGESRVKTELKIKKRLEEGPRLK